MTETGTGWPPEALRRCDPKWSRLGAVDRLALDLFDEIILLLDADAWQDRLEETMDAVTTVDPSDASEAALERFYEEQDEFEQRVLLRACRAVVNSLENRYDKISDLAQQRASEKAMQT